MEEEEVDEGECGCIDDATAGCWCWCCTTADEEQESICLAPMLLLFASLAPVLAASAICFRTLLLANSGLLFLHAITIPPNTSLVSSAIHGFNQMSLHSWSFTCSS